ncbi:MAG: hypothetical protein ACE3L7_25540 [Candidatus Pristimantibacillus sp.]
MLTIQEIITEADILVPNVLAVADKVVWLNQINQDFFNAVKIPKVARFTATAGLTDYTLQSDVRAKNIDLVDVGILKYRDLQTDDVAPLQNTFSYEDLTHSLTLSPAPYQNGLQGIVRYHRLATKTFTSGNLSAVPDAPEEYQWTYIPALAAWIANTQDDAAKAANYDAQYKAAWNVAAQNYQKE